MRLLGLILIGAFLPGFVLADCTTPAGKRGQFQVVGTNLLVCDGTAWASAAIGSAGGTCSGLQGKIEYDGTNLRFCNSTPVWQNLAGVAETSCTQPGMIVFEDPTGKLRYCGSGGNWMTVTDGADGDLCAGPTLPPIGTVCGDGTIYAGVFKNSGEGSDYKYFITPGNCNNSPTPTCNGATDGLKMAWSSPAVSPGGVEMVSSAAAKSTTSGSAYDTIAQGDSALSALRFCEQMDFGSKQDWFLPSKSELAYFYCKASGVNAHNTSNPQSDPDCASVGGRASLLPGFVGASASLYYWASTQNTASNAWAITFNNGSETGASKTITTSFYVRCARRVPIP